MLRVGLTGGLGSGKSTVAALLRALGAHVIESDELGRTLMEPGQPVYNQIVQTFGPEVVAPDGRLNRSRLAALAFSEGRLQDLNAIVHPAVIAAQIQWMNDIFVSDPQAVAVVESALIFEVERDARLRGETNTLLANIRTRIDRIVVVTAPESTRIDRYVTRICASAVSSHQHESCRESAAADARRRIAQQLPEAEKTSRADYILDNTSGKPALEAAVRDLWHRLKTESQSR